MGGELMATKMGKKFRTRRGRWGAYKYVNGRRVAFIPSGKGHGHGRKKARGWRSRR